MVVLERVEQETKTEENGFLSSWPRSHLDSLRQEDGDEPGIKRPKRDLVRPEFAYDSKNREQNERRALRKREIQIDCSRRIPTDERDLFEFDVDWNLLHDVSSV